ncbi:unnamed protein product, partial [Ixodes persulcatus]
EQDPEYHARAAARWSKWCQDPLVCEKEAKRNRRRRAADDKLREHEADTVVEAARRQDPAVREREAEAARQRRQEDLQNVREREAARKRAYRQADPDAARAREASAKRIRRAQPEGADARFKRDFLDVSFGHSCGVCDRLGF